VDAELAQDRADVMVDRLGRYEEPIGDLLVAQPLLHQREHLDLARRQARDVRTRSGAWPARDA
jgi:hypothetical protein